MCVFESVLSDTYPIVVANPALDSANNYCEWPVLMHDEWQSCFRWILVAYYSKSAEMGSCHLGFPVRLFGKMVNQRRTEKLFALERWTSVVCTISKNKNHLQHTVHGAISCCARKCSHHHSMWLHTDIIISFIL